jgi:hypothetical protein
MGEKELKQLPLRERTSSDAKAVWQLRRSRQIERRIQLRSVFLPAQ